MIDIEIDKLTNSIEELATGVSKATLIFQLNVKDFVGVKEEDWNFDWNKELNTANKRIFKLVTKDEPTTIQGLISIEDKNDHIFMHLIENAIHNKDKDRKYNGVAGNMVAFACKTAFELGYDGFISFISKTALKQHYQKTLGAKILFGDTMVIETNEAKILVEKYFNK
jgi:hypothetical protein